MWKEIEVTSGDDVNVPCNAINVSTNDTVRWLYSPNSIDPTREEANDTFLQELDLNNRRKHIAGELNSSLLIENIKTEDEGYYFCTTNLNSSLVIREQLFHVKVLSGIILT